VMMSNEGDRFVRIAGAAADGVRRVVVFLNDGQRQQAFLRDNLFTALVAAAQFPARVVAYDASGRVVGIIAERWFIRGQAPAAARALRTAFRVEAPRGATAVARIGREVRRYRCWRVDVSTGASPGGCVSQTFVGGPGFWNVLVQPAGRDLFVIGNVVGRVAHIQLEFLNGDVARARPVGGLFVVAVPREHLRNDRQSAFLRTYDSAGDRGSGVRVVFKVR
jgi:hypothetical protein